MRNIHIYIGAHQELDYDPQFKHTLIGLDGANLENSISSKKYLPDFMENDRTFAYYRAVWVALALLREQQINEDEFMTVWGHRWCLGTRFLSDVNRSFTENVSETPLEQFSFRTMRSPAELQNSWGSDILLKMPEAVELVISRPLNFGISAIEQYSRVHCLDDLMFGVGIALRLGFLRSDAVAFSLSHNIHINGFVGRISFYRFLFEKLFILSKEFYEKFYIKRDGYQCRSINFVLERIVSFFLIQKIYFEKIPTLSVDMVQISKDKNYFPGA